MNLWFDLKYAWRLMWKTPGHSVLCIVVVALSVGLALWSYTLAYAMAFKPLPFPSTERWQSILVAANATARPRAYIDAYTYQELLRRNRSANHLGALSFKKTVLSEGQASTAMWTTAITPRLLTAMETPPLKGRIFTEADSKPGAAPVAILSFDAWKNQFASDPNVVGKQARIDGQPIQVIGIMPEGFITFVDSSIWIPLQLKPLASPRDSSEMLTALLILEKGQKPETLLAEMKAPVDDVNHRYPDLFNAERKLELVPSHLTFTHMNLQMVATVSFLAASVLLLGCVNISMIFLARLLERSRELALRTAVGASRGRLLRQCLLETGVVVVLGLLLGSALASLGVDWMQSIDSFGRRIQATGRAPNLPTLRTIDLLAAVAAATLLWLLSTLIPAWRVARQDASMVLAGAGKGVAGPGSARGASFLVGLQVIISSLALVMCANLVFALREEAGKPTGVTSSRVMISTYLTDLETRYPEAADRLRYWDELTGSIKSRIPGTEVAYATVVPTRPANIPVAIEGQEGTAKQGTFTLPFATVSDNYFGLLGITPRSGRFFDSTDTSSSLAVAVIDERTAQRHWPGQDVIGKRIQLTPAENGPWLTIVGVASAVTRAYAREIGVVYRPLRQVAPTSFHLVAKLPNAAGDRRVALRAAAFAVDRDLPLHNLQTLDEFFAALNLSTSAMIPAFSAIATITLILSATGLFGLISRSVARRTQEVGVRRALGGTQWQVTSVFLRQGALYMCIAVIGGGLGILVANMISTSIPNILGRAVPVTMAVLIVMGLVIFTASYLPTRRAVGLEPGDALRYE